MTPGFGFGTHTVPTAPSVPHAGSAGGRPGPLPQRGPRSSTLSFAASCGGPLLCFATLHVKQSEAAEMCTADGGNYFAHLTSEIFFLLSPFSTNYSKTGEIDRFLVHAGF